MVQKTVVKRVYSRPRPSTRSRSRSSGGASRAGIVTNLVSGAAASVAGQFATKFIGPWGNPAAIAGVGYFAKNPTLMTIAGMQAGSMVNVGGMLGGSSSGVSGSGAI